MCRVHPGILKDQKHSSKLEQNDQSVYVCGAYPDVNVPAAPAMPKERRSQRRKKCETVLFDVFLGGEWRRVKKRVNLHCQKGCTQQVEQHIS